MRFPLGPEFVDVIRVCERREKEKRERDQGKRGRAVLERRLGIHCDSPLSRFMQRLLVPVLKACFNCSAPSYRKGQGE
jgi:hypothetical protein